MGDSATSKKSSMIVNLLFVIRSLAQGRPSFPALGFEFIQILRQARSLARRRSQIHSLAQRTLLNCTLRVCQGKALISLFDTAVRTPGPLVVIC